MYVQTNYHHNKNDRAIVHMHWQLKFFFFVIFDVQGLRINELKAYSKLINIILLHFNGTKWRMLIFRLWCNCLLWLLAMTLCEGVASNISENIIEVFAWDYMERKRNRKIGMEHESDDWSQQCTWLKCEIHKMVTMKPF